jgi:hypothetical protein
MITKLIASITLSLFSLLCLFSQSQYSQTVKPSGKSDTTNGTLPLSCYLDMEYAYTLSEDIIPAVQIGNCGDQPISFTVELEVMPGYTSSKLIENLNSDSVVIVAFDKWVPDTLGRYEFMLHLSSEDSSISGNLDTLIASVYILDSLYEMEWHTEVIPPIPYIDPMVFYTKPEPNSALDSGYIFLVRTATKSPEKEYTHKYNIHSRVWSEAATIVNIIDYYRAVYIKGNIYAPGGSQYSGPSPLKRNNVFDIQTGLWSYGVDLLREITKYALGVYGDSLMYVIGGSDYWGPYQKVQIYNVKSRIWDYGTKFDGKFNSNHKGTIVKNKILLVGGIDTETSQRNNKMVIGEIDTTNPYKIKWKTSVYPGGKTDEMAFSGWETKNGGFAVFSSGIYVMPETRCRFKLR